MNEKIEKIIEVVRTFANAWDTKTISERGYGFDISPDDFERASKVIKEYEESLGIWPKDEVSH
jgi:hypothetical protein